MSSFKGKAILIEGTEQVTEKFRKRLIVVSDEHEEYPQTVPFTFVQDNVSKLDNVKEGDQVEVTYELRGREWKGKYFADIQGWKIEVLSKGSSAAKPATKKATSPQEAVFESDTDDLPF